MLVGIFCVSYRYIVKSNKCETTLFGILGKTYTYKMSKCGGLTHDFLSAFELILIHSSSLPFKPYNKKTTTFKKVRIIGSFHIQHAN